ASANLAFPHAGLSALWYAGVGTPPDKPAVTHRKHPPALCGFAPHDWGALAQRAGGGLVRLAPAPRRIGRLGGGTQGRAQRVLLHAHTVGVCTLCGSPKSKVQCPKSRITHHASRFTLLPS